MVLDKFKTWNLSIWIDFMFRIDLNRRHFFLGTDSNRVFAGNVQKKVGNWSLDSTETSSNDELWMKRFESSSSFSVSVSFYSHFWLRLTKQVVSDAWIGNKLKWFFNLGFRSFQKTSKTSFKHFSFNYYSLAKLTFKNIVY
jgi:hypothetical protein